MVSSKIKLLTQKKLMHNNGRSLHLSNTCSGYSGADFAEYIAKNKIEIKVATGFIENIYVNILSISEFYSIVIVPGISLKIKLPTNKLKRCMLWSKQK